MNLENIVDIKVSNDRSVKILWKGTDSSYFESALIPFEKKNTYAICLSSQKGCNLGCKICSTKNYFYPGNLNISVGDLIDQALLSKQTAEKYYEGMIFDEFAFMGVGEPMNNIDNIISAISSRQMAEFRFAVSTVGIVPGIIRLMNSGLNDLPRLQISLHKIDEREKIIPTERIYPIDRVLNLGIEYARKSGKPLSLNWVILDGINDTLDEARKIAEIVDPNICRINVTNYVGNDFTETNPHSRELFVNTIREHSLRYHGLEVEVNSYNILGTDISAGCGQLIGNILKGKK